MNPHVDPPSHPREMLASAWRNRSLIVQLSKRDVLGRYRGSLAGMAWSFFNPLLMLGIYTFVFSTIFKSRWALASLDESRAGFAIILFVGIIIHGLLSECINKAPGLILNNANYVKKVVFPLEILPWVVMSSALFHAFISLLVLLLAELAVGHGIPWTVVLIPMVILPLVFVVMGMTWFISATSVYVRDIAQMTGVFASALMFLAPVFYPLSSLPEQYRAWMYLNPLTFIIEQARGVLIAGTLPDWGALGGYFLLSLLFAWIGFWWFQRSRRGFSDVI